MAVLRLEGVAAEVGGRRLFADVWATVDAGARIALVGPNGAGKSTLLAIAAERLAPVAGRVTRAAGARVGYLGQDVSAAADDNRSVWEAAYAADGGEIAALEASLRALEAEVATSPDRLEAYGEALDRYERLGGYAWATRVREHLAGVGLRAAETALPLGALSGGQRVRLALARLLLVDRDVLLLDEPTNHLDIAAIRWLEDTLRRTRAAVVFVSHDRAFLGRVADAVWSLDRLGFERFAGGYDAYRRDFEARLAQRANEAERTARERERLVAFVRKWRAGTRSRQAKDRERKLARLEVATLPGARRRLRLRFAGVEPADGGRRVRGLVLEAVSAVVGGRVLWRDLDLTLPEGERLGVVGANGSGKSTLLRLLAGDLRPAAGRVLWAERSRIAWLRQHVDGASGATVLDTVLALTGMTRQEARRRLAEGLFTPEQLDTPVTMLSGGERTRLALVALAARAPNVLLLDEPTNHLDIDGQEALEQALAAFSGTVVVASHDRAFLAATTRRWLVLDPPAPPRLVESLPEVWGGSAAAPARAGGRGPRRSPQDARPSPPARRPDGRTLARRLSELEVELASLEARRRELEALFAGPYTPERGARHAEYERLAARLEAAWAEWLGVAEAIEGADGAVGPGGAF